MKKYTAMYMFLLHTKLFSSEGSIKEINETAVHQLSINSNSLYH